MYAVNNEPIYLTKYFLFSLIYSLFTTMPILFLISFPFLFSRKGHLLYLIYLDLFISLLFIVDIVYFRAFGHLISIYMIFAQNVTEDLGASILSLIKWTDFLVFFDLPFLYIFAFRSKKTNNIYKNFYMFALVFILSVSAIVYQFKNLEKSNLALGDIKMRPAILSPIGAHLFDVYRFIYERGYELDEQDISTITGWLTKNAAYQNPAEKYASWEGLLKGKNLIVVQVESLESIVVGQLYYGQEITPNINKLLGSSIYFNNIHEQVRDGNSSDAELMFNTSIYPISSGSTFLRFGNNAYISLPNLLESKGYTSVAIHGDNKEYWNRSIAFSSLGFDRFVAEDEFENGTSSGLGILDESLFSQSFKEADKLKEPFYLFIITLTSHMPWSNAENMGGLDLPNNDETARYLQSINYVDKCFGDFYDQLDKNGFLDNSVLIIYGDHEGIHKYFPTTLTDNNKIIPYIVYAKGMDGVVIDNIGGQVDMMPTLAYLMGIDRADYTSGVMGRNLLGNNSGEAILPAGNIIGKVEDKEQLTEAEDIANLIIRGNYFNHVIGINQ